MSDLPDPRFLDERLAHWAETKPDTEAMTYLGRTWTWAEWNDRVRRLAGALTERGIKRGDVIALCNRRRRRAARRRLGERFGSPAEALQRTDEPQRP